MYSIVYHAYINWCVVCACWCGVGIAGILVGIYMAIILLENIRSILNVGSVFRTADAVGAERVLLAGYTPAPIDRMGRVNEKLHKTALGAEGVVPWSSYTSAAEAIAAYPAHTPVVVEQTPDAVPYTELAVDNPLFIFGNEVEGVAEETLEQVPLRVFLPMRGGKESLNVAVCAGVVLYHFAAITSSFS